MYPFCLIKLATLNGLRSPDYCLILQPANISAFINILLFSDCYHESCDKCLSLLLLFQVEVCKKVFSISEIHF